MIAGIADTHSALWYLFDDERLSVAAGDFIDQAGRGGTQDYRFVDQPCRNRLSHREEPAASDRLYGSKTRACRSGPRFQRGPLHRGNRRGHAAGPTSRGAGHAGPHRRGDSRPFWGSGYQPRWTYPEFQNPDSLVTLLMCRGGWSIRKSR